MPVSYDAGTRVVHAETYRLRLDPGRPCAELLDVQRRPWSRLSLIAGADPLDGRDTSCPLSGPAVADTSTERVRVVQELRSAIWTHSALILDCYPGHLAVTFEVATDRPRILDRVTIFGGAARLPNGAVGTFRSGIAFDSVLVPAPSEPVAPLRSAAIPASIGVVGDADPGRLHGVFSPAPFAYAFCRDAEWLACWLRAGIEECSFTDLRYQPLDGGFLIELDHQANTEVVTSTRMTMVLAPTESATAALTDYRTDLRDHGLLPRPAGVIRPTWWAEPIFCGWGAQCAESVHQDRARSAADLCRQDLYDGWLARLADRGIVPGTIVLDDRWQLTYGTGEPDPQRWPDLRSWIAARHAAGQRVLLWWKAWDPEGIPTEECLTDPFGAPVAVDPGNPRYQQRLAEIIGRLLGAEGLDADGLKIDFTQRAPAGPGLLGYRRPEGHGPAGVFRLHQLLSIMYGAAKAADPECLIITHTVNPLFADVTDMIRLNDITERDLDRSPVPVVDQMAFRQNVARAVLPDHLIDTDQWPMPDREQWLAYCDVQPELGVPSLYYVDLIDNSRELITDSDLDIVAKSWRRYRDWVVAGE